MKRIAAIISGGDFENRRGLLNAALSRIEHLQKYPEFEIEIFSIKVKYSSFSFKSFFSGEYENSFVSVDNNNIHVITRIEYYSNNKLFRKPLKIYYKLTKRRLQDWEWHKELSKYFKHYDAIIAHSIDAAIVAENVNKRFSIPFFVTWHGSDIHTIPFNDECAKVKVVSAIEHASCNFFVSKELMKVSAKLTKNGFKVTSYNGVDTIFRKFDDNIRAHLRVKYGASSGRVVTFAGNLRKIKNADMLPRLFLEIQRRYDGKILFWIIGDGNLKEGIQNETNEKCVSCVFWGGQPKERMPEFFNCTDVLILPSQNEGLPLVVLEALSCGANVVGSNVGGIPEVIERQFCVSFSPTFVGDFADRVVALLNSEERQYLSPKFSWANTSREEVEIINRFFAS